MAMKCLDSFQRMYRFSDLQLEVKYIESHYKEQRIWTLMWCALALFFVGSVFVSTAEIAIPFAIVGFVLVSLLNRRVQWLQPYIVYVGNALVCAWASRSVVYTADMKILEIEHHHMPQVSLSLCTQFHLAQLTHYVTPDVPSLRPGRWDAAMAKGSGCTGIWRYTVYRGSSCGLCFVLPHAARLSFRALVNSHFAVNIKGGLTVLEGGAGPHTGRDCRPAQLGQPPWTTPQHMSGGCRKCLYLLV